MSHFAWDPQKEVVNIRKHGIGFALAVLAFQDPQRHIYLDASHSGPEQRFFCFGKVDGKIITVRFVYRENTVRIFGAGYWRKGRKFYYEKKGE